jgi:hypothetical protein
MVLRFSAVVSSRSIRSTASSPGQGRVARQTTSGEELVDLPQRGHTIVAPAVC